MNKSEKEQAVQGLHEKMSRATLVVAVAHDRLDAQTDITLRRAMRAGQIDYKVVKNTLALRAAKGTAVEKLASYFEGPVAVALGYGDVVSSAKTVHEAFKKAPEKLKVKALVADGEVHGAAGLEAFAKLPGLPELRATLLSMINTPASTLVRLLNTPGGQLARALQARVDKEGGEKQAA